VVKADDSDELRNELFNLELNTEDISKYLEKLESINNPSPRVIAYKGATCAFLAKYMVNPLKKLYYLQKSENYLDRAIRRSPDDVEIHFFRFMTQSQIPSFLGMSGNVREDKAYIMAHLDEFKIEGITPNIISFVSGFLNSSRYCTSEEAKMLADSLYSM
jgi:hypothetical protein